MGYKQIRKRKKAKEKRQSSSPTKQTEEAECMQIGALF